MSDESRTCDDRTFVTTHKHNIHCPSALFHFQHFVIFYINVNSAAT